MIAIESHISQFLPTLLPVKGQSKITVAGIRRASKKAATQKKVYLNRDLLPAIRSRSSIPVTLPVDTFIPFSSSAEHLLPIIEKTPEILSGYRVYNDLMSQPSRFEAALSSHCYAGFPVVNSQTRLADLAVSADGDLFSFDALRSAGITHFPVEASSVHIAADLLQGLQTLLTATIEDAELEALREGWRNLTLTDLHSLLEGLWTWCNVDESISEWQLECLYCEETEPLESLVEFSSLFVSASVFCLNDYDEQAEFSWDQSVRVQVEGPEALAAHFSLMLDSFGTKVLDNGFLSEKDKNLIANRLEHNFLPLAHAFYQDDDPTYLPMKKVYYSHPESYVAALSREFPGYSIDTIGENMFDFERHAHDFTIEDDLSVIFFVRRWNQTMTTIGQAAVYLHVDEDGLGKDTAELLTAMCAAYRRRKGETS